MNGGDLDAYLDSYDNRSFIIGFDQKLAELISYLLNGFFTAFFVFTGVLLNVICVIIHLKHNRRSTPVIHYYLVALTGWQTALLINAFILYCFPTLMLGKVEQGAYVYVYSVAYTLANATHTATVWIVLMLTIDRYFALCRPLVHHVGRGRSRAKWLVICSSIFAIIFCMPRFFEIRVISACDSNGTNCYPMIIQTTFSSDPTYFKVYRIALVTLTVTVVPCILIFVFTSIISCELRSAYLRRKSLCPKASDPSSRGKGLEMRRDRKANIMLVLVIAKFLLSDILPTVADVLELAMGSDVFNSSSAATILVAVSNFLLVVNCSTNFWIFLLWGKHFREMFKELIANFTNCAKQTTSLSKQPEILSSCCGRTKYTTFTECGERNRCYCSKCKTRRTKETRSNVDLFTALLQCEHSIQMEEPQKLSSFQLNYDKSKILALLATELQQDM